MQNNKITSKTTTSTSRSTLGPKEKGKGFLGPF